MVEFADLITDIEKLFLQNTYKVDWKNTKLVKEIKRDEVLKPETKTWKRYNRR